MGLVEPGWNGGTTFSCKGKEFWKTFLEGTMHAFRVPNEMTDSERRKIFAGIPGGEAGHRAVAFILPNSFPNSQRIGIGNTKRFRPEVRSGQTKEKQTSSEERAETKLS